MNNRSIDVCKIPTHTDGHVIKLSVSYTQGGTSFYDHSEIKQGFHLHVQPMEVSTEHGFSVSKFMLGSGCRVFLQPATRYSKKTHVALCQQVAAWRDAYDPKVWAPVQAMAEKAGVIPKTPSTTEVLA